MADEASAPWRDWRNWTYGALAGLAAAALRIAIQPLLGDNLPFIFAFPATVISALLFGAGPGMLAAALCATVIGWPAIPPDVAPAQQPLQIGTFLIGAIVIALLCGRFGSGTPARERAARVGSPAGSAAMIETPLTSWLRTLLWGAVLIPATAFVLIAWWGYQRADQQVSARAAHASDLAWRHAQRTLATATTIAQRVDAMTSGPDEQIRADEGALHRRLEDLIVGSPSVLNLNVWDADGHPLVGSDAYPSVRSASVADRPYFIEQRDGSKGASLSEVVVGRQSGRLIINVVVRRASSDGTFRGVVSTSMAPGFFVDYYRSLASEEPGVAQFALVRDDGKLLASLGSRTGDDVIAPLHAAIRARRAAGASTGVLTLALPALDDASIVGWRRIEPFPAYVVAGFSRHEMLVGWFRFMGLLAAVLVPTTAGLLYVGSVALKRTRRAQAVSQALQDETQRRAAAERAMLESQKFETLALLTGGVAHDFNNLLAVVHTNLHVLNRTQPQLADSKPLTAISRAVQTGTRLTRQLLSFSRKQALRPEIVDLRRWLPSAEALARSTLRSNVEWSLVIDRRRPLVVEIDVAELELALINLVVNANHAMLDGGKLTITATATTEDTVAIAVADSGVGIPPEVLGRVCEPFFTTRPRGTGSGLGLSQVQALCARSGGKLKIESEVGRGTVVTLEIPRASAPLPVAGAAGATASAPLHGRVLLVEDNEDVAQTMETMLRAAGLDVVRAANAAAALSTLDDDAALRPDVVLSDIEMPGRLNGIRLAFSLRTHQPDLPVILMTGYADQIDEATAGGLRVLPKPIAPERLLAEIAAALRHDRSHGRASAETPA